MVDIEDEPDVLFIDISELENGFEVAETFKASHESEIVLISAEIGKEYFRRAMQVGARDLLIKPLNSEEVLESLEKINNLLKRNKKGYQGNGMAKIITVFSTKGGVGKTTIATNTAVCLEKNTGKNVVVIDLDLEFGCMAAMFGLRANPNIVDLCNTEGPLDPEVVEKVLQVPVMTRVKVLVAPPTPDLAAAVEGDGRKDKHRNYISEIISILEQNYDYIIIDTASNFRETNLTALDRSDKILLVTTPDIPTLQNTGKCLDILLEKLDYNKEKIQLVLNRSDGAIGLTEAEIIESLDYPISYRIPSDGKVVVKAANLGEPFVCSVPQKPISQSIDRLSKSIAIGFGDLMDGEIRKPKNKKNSFFQRLFEK